MVERTAHNGNNVGSNPTKPTEENNIQKFVIKFLCFYKLQNLLVLV